MRASVFPFIVTTGLSVEVCWLWATYNSAACYMFGGFNHRGCQVFGTLGFLQFFYYLWDMGIGGFWQQAGGGTVVTEVGQ